MHNKEGANAVLNYQKQGDRTIPLGIHCGSLFGEIRNWLGIEGVSYLYADDEDLYDGIIHTKVFAYDCKAIAIVILL